MYYLLFHNGHDVPVIEAAFAADFMVVEYTKAFIPLDKYSECYFVLLANKTTCIPLKKFIESHKEVKK